MLFAGCRHDEGTTTEPTSGRGRTGTDVGKSALPAPAGPDKPVVKLKVYPDMAVPGAEVVIEAQLVPPVLSETPAIKFAAIQDPCEGEVTQDGQRAVYKVPAKCRGSKIVIEATASGTFGESRETVSLDIKKSIRIESVVISYPQPNERVVSPVLLLWDRTLYENRKETLSFRASRGNETVLQTRDFAPDSIVELDVPPSPDPLILHASVAGGSAETASLRVFERVLPERPGGAMLIDSFDKPDVNSLGEPRGLLTTGGEALTGMGARVAADGEHPFLYMVYHVRKGSRMERGQTVMGIVEEIRDSTATAANYETLRVWLRGDPVRGFSTPVYVEVQGAFGSKRAFKIVRLRPTWTEFRFPLNGVLRSGGKDWVRKVSVYVDSKDVYPPLSTVMFGGMYLVPKVREGQSPIP